MVRGGGGGGLVRLLGRLRSGLGRVVAGEPERRRLNTRRRGFCPGGRVGVVSCAFLVAAFVVTTAAPSPLAHAQEDFIPPKKPVDLAVGFSGPGLSTPRHYVVVTNNSEVDVYDVVVDVETDPPRDIIRSWDGRFGNRDWGGSLGNGKWTIPHIRPGGQEELSLNHDDTISGSAVFVRVNASIVSSSPKEPRAFEYNNRAEKWFSSASIGVRDVEDSGVGVQVEVDNLRPALGGQAVFKVSAKHTGSASNSYDKEGVQVRITLSPGLSFASSLSDTTVSGNTAIWRAGDLEGGSGAGNARTEILSVPVSLSGSVPLESRCLTAEVVEVTPPDVESERFDDVATVCLGDGPVELVSSTLGIDLFSSFPCIGVSTWPCNTDDTLELVTEVYLNVGAYRVGPYVYVPSPTKQRRDDTASPPNSGSLGVMFLQPESLVIHVDDRRGREVMDGSVIWSTGDLMDLTDNWRRLTSGGTVQQWVTVTAPGGGDAPGRWVMAADLGGHDLQDVLNAPDSSRVTYDATDLAGNFGSDPNDYSLDIALQFWALGTYVVLFENSVILSGSTYTDSGTYVFHVGPVSELEVRDAGASPDVGANRRAFTVEAVNHGPDTAEGVEVTLVGVPEGANVVASRGRYAAPACQDGLCEGVWSIDGLEASELVRLSGKSASATLTVIGDGTPHRQQRQHPRSRAA